jgi:hypothetical protein
VIVAAADEVEVTVTVAITDCDAVGLDDAAADTVGVLVASEDEVAVTETVAATDDEADAVEVSVTVGATD